ncbi:TetR/AcrR family transcriptional regulator [Leucobacter chinensis]|uniref:TetR/AcrR family transcriptional regulator n=1 Tax=Leucobacter chinensis TaxID=2851010 RepID=UPI001C22DE22|nr:TetR/AcrR family transcriptional regulator [Leucobacter chinensis]
MKTDRLKTAPTPARDRLMEAAGRLFYSNGMNATGIDTITAEAGVARKSLYNNFSSKDELMLAYIDARHAEWLELYEARLAGARSPAEKVLAVFDAYIDHAEAGSVHGFRGCGLLNAAAELPVDAAGREAVRRHKEQVESILVEHLNALERPDANDLAEHCAFILEGAMTRAGLEGSTDKLVRARCLAEQMLANQ